MDLSYIHRPDEFRYHYETIPERLKDIAEKFGNKNVYVFLHPDGRRDSISANELYKKARNLACSLMKLGIRQGDIVATCLYNEIDLLVCTFGVIFAGATILNLVIRNEDGSDLKKILNRLDVKCLIINPGEDHKHLHACMHFIGNVGENGSINCQSVPSLQVIISTEMAQEMQLLQLDGLIIDQKDSLILPRLDPESIVILLPTSGSTGDPKVVPHSHHDAMLIGYHLKESIGYETDDIIYTERRISWMGGFPFMLLHDGVKVVTKTKPFVSLKEHCDFTYTALKDENCSIACLMPATVVGLLEKINNMPEPAKFLLKNIHLGSIPVDSVCMNAIGVLSRTVTNCYGSTEMGFCTSNVVQNKEEYVNYCVGLPHGGFEVKVVDDDGFVVGREVVGNLCVRSPCMFQYYYRDERKTKEVLSPNRWMDTDDIGYMRKDGKIVAQGRKSDIILQGGRYIFPTRIEAFIKNHPDVLDVLVISVPDSAFFELACACVIPFPGKALTSDDIDKFYTEGAIYFANEAFANDKPNIIMTFESFPTVYTGKPDKKALKRQVLARLQKA